MEWKASVAGCIIVGHLRPERIMSASSSPTKLEAGNRLVVVETELRVKKMTSASRKRVFGPI